MTGYQILRTMLLLAQLHISTSSLVWLLYLPSFQHNHSQLLKNNMTNKSIKVIQSLKDIGEEFAGRSSIHGLGYISDPHLHVCDRLLWLFFFLGGLCFAIFFNISSYNAWQDNMVVTNLRSTGRPVSQLDFPTVTICGSGLHMGNIEEALR